MIDNWVWATGLVALLATMTWIAWMVNRPSFLIVALHNLVWAGAIGLVGTNLIRYAESGALAWLTLAVGLVCFNVGAQLSKWTPKWLQERAFRREQPAARVTSLVSRRVFYTAVSLYAVAFAWYLTNIHVRFGLDTLIFNPVEIRSAPGASYLETVPLPIRVLLYLGPLLFALLGFKESFDRPLSPWIRLAGMILLAGSMLALLQRTNLFMGILLLVALLLTQPRGDLGAVSRIDGAARRRRLLRVAGSVVLACVVAFVAFQGLANALGKQGSQARSTGTVSDALEDSGLQSPFFYYTAGTVALLQLTESTNEEWPPEPADGKILVGDYNPQTWGSATFSPLLRALPGIEGWANISPFIETPAWTNVYTWLEPLYRDFRAPGVAIGSLLAGWMITFLYSCRTLSTRAFWLQAALVSTIPLATFVPKVNNTLFLAEVIFILILGTRIVRRPRDIRDSSAEVNQVAS